MRRFTWWDSHASAWRRTRLLFVLAGAIVSIYAAGILVVVGVSLVALVTGSVRDVQDLVGDLGVLGVSLAAVATLVAIGLAVLGIGWRGLPRTTVRLTRARPPVRDEERRVGAATTSFALAFGMPAPRVWIVDDPAPNSLAFGRPADGHVCVTTGALGLARRELDALCMFEVTALASRAYTYATAAADLVLLAEWLVRVLWSVVAFVALSSLFGVPLEIAAAYFVSTIVIVALTRPLLALARRGLVALIDETATLVDLETIRQSAQPASLATLLLDLADDRRAARSRPEIAHLWFERDVVEVDGGTGRISRLRDFVLPDIGLPTLGARDVTGTRRGLLQRAAAAVDLANGDAALRGRLERAGTTG